MRLLSSVPVMVLVLSGCWTLTAATPGWAAPKSVAGIVNINAASAAELQLLPGIGPAKAERIVAYRKTRPFRTVEELARVKGIGPRTVRKLKPHLAVKGETTAGQSAGAKPEPGSPPPPRTAPSRPPPP